MHPTPGAWPMLGPGRAAEDRKMSVTFLFFVVGWCLGTVSGRKR